MVKHPYFWPRSYYIPKFGFVYLSIARGSELYRSKDAFYLGRLRGFSDVGRRFSLNISPTSYLAVCFGLGVMTDSISSINTFSSVTPRSVRQNERWVSSPLLMEDHSQSPTPSRSPIIRVHLGYYNYVTFEDVGARWL